MSDLLRSEVLKTQSIKGTLLLLVSAVMVVALATASTMLSMPPDNLDGPIHEQVAYFIGSVIVAVFALIVGMRSFTDEFRHRTIVPTILATESRGRLLVAKITVAVGVVLLMSILGLVTLVSIALGLARVKGGDLSLAISDWEAFAGFLGAMVGWTVLGTGLGSMIRSQIAGVVGALVWVLVVENFATGFLGEAAKFMPGQLAHGMAQASSAVLPLGVLPSAALFAGYIVLVCAVAGVMFEHRDVI